MEADAGLSLQDVIDRNARTGGMDERVDLEKTIERMPVADRKELEELFNAVDIDSSGSVSVEELHSRRRELGIRTESFVLFEDWVNLVNSVGDGEILCNEFVVLMFLTKKSETARVVYSSNGLDSQRDLFRPKKRSIRSAASSNKQAKSVSFKTRLWLTLEDPEYSRSAALVAALITSTVMLSIITFLLESIEPLHRKPGVQETFQMLDYFCAAVFSLEFLLRLVTTPNLKGFFFRWDTIVDIVSIAPFYLTAAFPALQGWRVLRLARVARLLKISRYVEWLRLFGSALTQAMFPLLIALLVCLVYTCIFASLIFYAEKLVFDTDTKSYVGVNGSIDVFQSIFDGIYFAVISVTTVGYGDIRVKSQLGKAFGSIGLFVGILIFAIPISVFSTHFEFEYDGAKQKQERENQRRREAWRERTRSSFFAKTGGKRSVHPFDSKAQQQQRLLRKMSNARKTGRTRKSSRLATDLIQGSWTDDNQSPKQALASSLEVLDSSDEIKGLADRNQIRKALLQHEIQRAVDLHREKMWVKFRTLERRQRERLMVALLDKYASWFLRRSERMEEEILQAVRKIQKVYRGNLARIAMSAKMVAKAKKARDTVDVE